MQGLGRWLIASRLGAFAEAIEDGVSGRLVAPEDPQALAAALREVACDRRPADRAAARHRLGRDRAGHARGLRRGLGATAPAGADPVGAPALVR